jgi:hypothetical protein
MRRYTPLSRIAVAITFGLAAGLFAVTGARSMPDPISTHIATAAYQRPQLRQTVKLPYCPSNVEVCLESITIAYRASTVAAIGAITIKVKHGGYPRAFELYTSLQYRYRGQWQIADSKTYRLHDLPLTGTRTLTPVLEAPCLPAYWRVTGHLIALSSTGEHTNIWIYYPAKKNDKKSAIFSTEPIKNNKLRAGIKLTCRT